MSYRGDINLDSTIDIKFCTVTTTGAPTQLAGTPVISAYPDNSITQLTAGITLTVEDSRLQVEVHDDGKGIGQVHPPRIEDQIEGKYKPRGWGVFLIKSLMDNVEFETMPEGGNVVRMILYIKKND